MYVSRALPSNLFLVTATPAPGNTVESNTTSGAMEPDKKQPVLYLHADLTKHDEKPNVTGDPSLWKISLESCSTNFLPTHVYKP